MRPIPYTTQPWPDSGWNHDCREFIAPGPSWGGLAEENNQTSNCRLESQPYFIGDLVAQVLWHGRTNTADLDSWESVVLEAAASTRDCSPSEPVCPEMISDFLFFVHYYHGYALSWAAEVDDWHDILVDRGLSGPAWIQ
jgi:hypothetical protein